MAVRGGSSRSYPARRFDLSKVDSRKSRETSRRARVFRREGGGTNEPAGREGGKKREERRGNEPPVTCTASGVEMSDLSARARWRVSTPVDQARCVYARRVSAGLGPRSDLLVMDSLFYAGTLRIPLSCEWPYGTADRACARRWAETIRKSVHERSECKCITELGTFQYRSACLILNYDGIKRSRIAT